MGKWNGAHLGIYNLLSGKQSLWEKGMNLLRADDKVNKNNNEVRDEAIEVISIKRNTPLEYGLNKQLAHMKNIKSYTKGSTRVTLLYVKVLMERKSII